MFKTIKTSIEAKINAYRYNRLAAMAEKPEFELQQLTKEGYFSQSGQDKWIIEKLFPGKKNGVFVDIGANDGITFSNTNLLEKIGWS